MKKIKVGYLPLYIKLYDDVGQDRTPLTRYMETLIKMLESQDLEVVRTDDLCRVKSEFDAAAKRFNEEKVDCVITQHLAYSPSLESIEALLSLEAPIVILDSTPDYSLIKTANYMNGIDNNHGIHGVQDMTCMLKKNHKPYYICAGHALHSDVIAKVVGKCRAAAAASFMKNAKIGSVGGSFVGMGDFLVSDERLKNDIGATVSYMTPDVVSKYLPQITEAEIDAELALDAKKCRNEITYVKEYREATRSGLAIRKWMEAEKLNCATVNFLTLDTCGLPKMPFIECCKIMGRGQGYAGEGDALTSALVGSLLSVYPNTTFTEMFCPDWEEDVILLSHMAESNPRVAAWSPLIADMNFCYNSCGNTVGMYNCLRKGKVVYVNLAPMDDHFSLVVSSGEILDVGLIDGAYHKNTQGWFKPHCSVPEFLTAFSEAGGTHHSALVYDADIEEIKTFGKMMGWKVTEI